MNEETAREELRVARETIRRLNRRCQEAERVLGDITKHPAVNQSRTGRMSYAVMALAVKKANEKVEEMERHIRAGNAAWTEADLQRAGEMIARGEISGRMVFLTLRSIRDLKVPPIREAGSEEART